MRNHKFVEKVVNKMIEYNNRFYIEDINELIIINQFGNDITLYLTNIVNILQNVVNNNNNENNNNNTSIKNALKLYIFRIIALNNGIECCNKLICEDV